MCGICGVLRSAGGSVPLEPAVVESMTRSLAHRGPDDSGVWHNDSVALGSRRLSVIDLSIAGHQPMSNEDGTVHIAYNGEVYNFRELKSRHRLEERGHVFRSKTDTEVILHLYEELGAEMLNELNGMFALAIWDARRKSLLLARDRFGIKPLFYQQDKNFFRFGSEIKALLRDQTVPRRPNLSALHDYLSFGYVPGTQTAFEGIFEVPPSHYMTISETGELHSRRYWNLDFNIDETLREDRAVQRTRELLEQAVQRRLIADVPIGVLLSGGLDSSTILALMANQSSEPVRTYSVGFEDPSFNELPWARLVAESFNASHHEVVVTPQRVRELLPKCIEFIDEPYADGSAIPTFCVCELAREDVVVVQSGEGGDEAFAGYDTHAAYKFSRAFRYVPRWLRQGILRPASNLLPVSNQKLSLDFKIKRFLGGQDLPPQQAHLWWRIILAEQEKAQLYSAETVEQLDLAPSVRHFDRLFHEAPAADDLNRLLYLDSSQFLPDDLMIKNDRMSMAHSLEARVPMTDPELMQFLAGAPLRVKYPGLRRKNLMKLAMRDLLPPKIIGKKKVGLEMPYSLWFKADLKDLLDDYLGRERVEQHGLFRYEAIDRIIKDHLQNRRDNGRPLWALVNYMAWLERYID